ncbi:SDR family oxidoreductase [candidate division WOR-3 bacterium]|nr:SDR family oxidoreductase [candidate division WOR-3 bacterium]
MKYLITGAAGFIGSNITRRLLKDNCKVRGFDNFSTGRRENLEDLKGKDNFKLIEGDLRNPAEIREAVKNIDIILHEAAVPSVQRSLENPVLINESNINGTLNLLIAAREAGVKKVVYASSSSIYGLNKKLPKIEAMPAEPISPYALSKYTGERYCQIFYEIYNLPTICLRYFNVFGPYQNPDSEYSAAIPIFINRILKDKQPVIFGDGEQSRDFTYVENVVEANILAANSKVMGEIINIASGERITINEVVHILNKFLNKKTEPVYKESRVGEVKHSLADISKAREKIGYFPKFKFIEGLRKTVEWYQTREKQIS